LDVYLVSILKLVMTASKSFPAFIYGLIQIF
jgi:hypothetical protein